MFSKNYAALFAVLALGAVSLVGCSSGDPDTALAAEQTAPTDTYSEIFEDVQTTESSSSTTMEETQTEISEAVQTTEDITTTTTVTDKDEGLEETSSSADDMDLENAEKIPELVDTVPFAYNRIGYDNGNNMDECFDSIPEELLNSARQALEGNERYDEFIAYSADNSEVQLIDFEDYIVDGVPQAEKGTSVYKDFDGDGSKEAFIMFHIPAYLGEIGQPEGGPDFGVFINSDGESELIYQGYGRFEGLIEYEGFTHLLIGDGWNRASIRNEIFSVKEGKAVKEYSYSWGVSIYDENDFIVENYQDPIQGRFEGYNAFKWDNDKDCYVFFNISDSALQRITGE